MGFTVVMCLVGIVLAAGAGTRAGGPKALRRTGDEAWVAVSVERLRAGGCDPVLVVLGAAYDEVLPLLPADAVPVHASDWADGVSSSLRAGLTAAAETGAMAAVVTLVDLPTLPRAVVARLLDRPVDATTLRRVELEGRPGHPVVLGRDHWEAVAASVSGDQGAGAYLRAHRAAAVECGDLWDGADHDGR
jgi:CTP:molybdopterin cytidylyltransferase MocA